MELATANNGDVAYQILPQRQQKQKRTRGNPQRQVVVVQRPVAVRAIPRGVLSKSQKKKLKKRANKAQSVDQVLNSMASQGYLGQTQQALTAAGLNIIEQLVLSIAAPMNQPIFRYSDQYSNSETAIANPFEKVKAQWKTTDGTQIGVNNTDLPAFIFRCAERASMIFDANPAGTAWGYDFYGTDEPTSTPAVQFTQQFNSSLDSEAVHIPYALPTTSYQPHGEIFMAGQCKDSPAGRFFWINDTDTLNINFDLPAGSGLTYKYAFALDHWDSDTGYVKNAAILAASSVEVGPGTINATSLASALAGWRGSGYYALRFSLILFDTGVPDYAGSVNILINHFGLTSTGACYGHRALKGYANNAASVNGIRVQAAAVRYCNVASMLNLQGQVTVLQLPEQKHWKDFVDYTALASVKVSEENTFDVRDGGYVYLKPANAEDLDFRSFTLSVGGVLKDSFYPIKEDAPFIACTASITNGDGRSGFFEICHGVEYQTTDVWRNVEKPKINPASFKAAGLILTRLPQYHKNKSHMDTILAGLKTLGSTMLKGALSSGMRILPGLLGI